jgi:Putative ATP-dependent DNA helicase recG C-terminal
MRRNGLFSVETPAVERNCSRLDCLPIMVHIDLGQLARRESEQTEWKESVTDINDVVAHRDYELVDPSRFTSYRDRIEFISPGALPTGVAIQDLREGEVTPRWRNQALAWVLSRLQLAQAEGQGIRTIRNTLRAAGCPPPVFKATEVSLTCVLPAHPRAGSWAGVADRGFFRPGFSGARRGAG